MKRLSQDAQTPLGDCFRPNLLQIASWAPDAFIVAPRLFTQQLNSRFFNPPFTGIQTCFVII